MSWWLWRFLCTVPRYSTIQVVMTVRFHRIAGPGSLVPSSKRRPSLPHCDSSRLAATFRFSTINHGFLFFLKKKKRHGRRADGDGRFSVPCETSRQITAGKTIECNILSVLLPCSAAQCGSSRLTAECNNVHYIQDNTLRRYLTKSASVLLLIAVAQLPPYSPSSKSREGGGCVLGGPAQ